MTIMDRLKAMLSRKFMAPIFAVIAFIIWQAWLQIIPINSYAAVVGVLFAGFLAVEGTRDIIIAIANAKKK